MHSKKGKSDKGIINLRTKKGTERKRIEGLSKGMRYDNVRMKDSHI